MEDNVQTPVAENLDTPEVNAPEVKADWYSSVPEEYREHPSLKKFKTPGDVFKSYVELEKYVGYDKVPIPKKPEDWDAFYDKLGRPKSAEDYKLPEVQFPEGFPASEQFKTRQKEFLELCHKKGILPEQAGGLYEWYMKETMNAYQQSQQSMTDGVKNAESSLRKEWGAAYKTKLGYASKLVKDHSTPELTELLNSGLGANPYFIRFLSSVGQKMSEDGFGGGKGGSVFSPEEAKTEIAKLQGDLKGPLYDKTHPEHTLMVKKLEGLFAQAYPEEPEKK